MREYPRMLFAVNLKEALELHKKYKMDMVEIISDMPLNVMEFWTNKQN